MCAVLTLRKCSSGHSTFSSYNRRPCQTCFSLWHSEIHPSFFFPQGWSCSTHPHMPIFRGPGQMFPPVRKTYFPPVVPWKKWPLASAAVVKCSRTRRSRCFFLDFCQTLLISHMRTQLLLFLQRGEAPPRTTRSVECRARI